MPQLFVSYAHQDLDIVRRLGQGLKDHGVAVWRDQERLYGGQQWPKALGDAIAACDGVVLVWSQHAAASDFVECEWNIAVALKKTIFPWVLDSTPLPSTLRATQGIEARALEDALPALLRAIDTLETSPDPENTRDILEKLDNITSAEPGQVAQELKSLYAVYASQSVVAQRDMRADGPVTQIFGNVGGPVTINPLPTISTPKKRLLKRWQTWVAMLAALLIIGMFLFSFGIIPWDSPGVQTVAGMIRDENGLVIPGVEVTLPEFQLTTTTDSSGRYTFRVEELKQRPVKLIARRAGYVTYHGDVTLGNPSHNFRMRKES